jgi:hypothetical protein
VSTVTLPRADIAIAGDDAPSKDWYRWARDITERVGGVTGNSTTDLTLSAFEDAGIEETKAIVMDVRGETGQAPVAQQISQDESQEADVQALHAALQALADRVQALEQGLSA